MNNAGTRQMRRHVYWWLYDLLNSSSQQRLRRGYHPKAGKMAYNQYNYSLYQSTNGQARILQTYYHKWQSWQTWHWHKDEMTTELPPHLLSRPVQPGFSPESWLCTPIQAGGHNTTRDDSWLAQRDGPFTDSHFLLIIPL